MVSQFENDPSPIPSPEGRGDGMTGNSVISPPKNFKLRHDPFFALVDKKYSLVLEFCLPPPSFPRPPSVIPAVFSGNPEKHDVVS